MKISQREARALRKRVDELEQREQARFARWSKDYVGGTNICSLDVGQHGLIHTAIKTARLLQHAVVVTTDDAGRVYFYALPSAT